MGTDDVQQFMDGPLVTWVRTFENDGGGSLTYGALADGVFLYDVMTHIDPPGSGGGGGGTTGGGGGNSGTGAGSGSVGVGVGVLSKVHQTFNKPINRCPDDPLSRLGNLAAVLAHVKAFYQEVLGQSVMLALPDVVQISRSPESVKGVVELKRLLLLVLGCAVQSTLKEDVIANIKKLSVSTQHALVQCIQQVTDNPEAVWPGEWGEVEAVPEEQLSRAFPLLVDNCRRLAQERDHYNHEFLKCALGEEDDEQEAESVHHLGVQLADLKAQLRRLRQEYDEKVECVSELKEDMEQTKTSISKLRQENVELVQDARAARAWRDEADILRERANRVDALEAEIARYRDKMSDIEFYKTRVEELREDNRILVETKEMLEEQLASSRRRAEQVLDLENTILQLKQSINHLNIDRDNDRDRLQEVLEDNAQLQLANKNSLSESATLVSQLDVMKNKSAFINGSSFSSDLIGDAQARVLKLQLENQRLEADLEVLKREACEVTSEKISELEKENKRLSHKVSGLQEASQKERTSVLEVQDECNTRQQDNQRLSDTIVTIKANTERQTSELQNENSQLQDLIENLRERQKKTTDTRLLDVENENKKLTDVNLQLQSHVSRLEYEKQQLNKLTERLRVSAEKLSEVEHQKTEVERENRDLHKAISAFKESCEKHENLEHNYADLEVEFVKVSRMLTNTKDTVAKLESSQSEKFHLQSEVERLTRSIESLKVSSTRQADLELEKEQLVQQMSHTQQQVTSLKADRSRAEKLELDLLTVNNELQKVQRLLETSQRKLHETERERTDVETENSKLQRTVETLKLSVKKLNDLERDLTDIEGTNDRLDRENKSLHKEVTRLRNTIEVKDGLVDDAASRVSTLERNNKRLNKELDFLRASDNRLRELEHEKRDLEQQTQVQRRTLSTLREDLVAEKVKTQQLTNQLDSLTSDLSKLGLNPDNLTSPISDTDHDRYKALEAMLEETLKRSMEVREEKISSLESRLTESVSRNKDQRKQLMQVRSEYESLLQRQQEESVGIDQHSSRQVAKLTDVLNRSNDEKSSLEGEVSSLTSQTASYREQVCALQSQVTSLSNQNTVMSQHNAKLQGEYARLQVENTTLQSQSASLIAQNSALQISASQLEADRDKSRRSFEERGSRLSQLVADHEALQRLHEQLTREYENLSLEYNNLKTSFKNLKMESKELKDRQGKLSANEDELLKLREVLEAEMANLKADSSSLTNLRAEHSRLKDDFRSLFSANERLRTEYKSLQGDYKAIKTENNTVKLRLTEMDGEINDSRDHIAALDVEVAKLTNKSQVLQTLNVTLEEDRRSLMSQVSLLLTQYHDLLTQTLEDKQHFHQEEKNFTDKVNNLRRQKEKLEEKIMEQYRRMDNTPNKKKGFGSNLVRRVRKAGNDLISKVPRTGRSRSRGRDEGDSPDSSSLGSSSQANDSLDSGSETRRSSPNLPPSPHNDSTGEGSERRTSRCSSSSHSHRKSLPPSISDLFLSHSIRGSVSSEDIGSVRSGEVSDCPKDDDTLSTVTGGSGTVELGRAGSRRPVYLTDDPDSIPTRDVGPEPLTEQPTRGRSSRSNSNASVGQNSNRNYSSSTTLSSIPPSTPRTPTPGGVPRSSTPKLSTTLKERAIDGEHSSLPSTPRLPPRTDNSNRQYSPSKNPWSTRQNSNGIYNKCPPGTPKISPRFQLQPLRDRQL